MYDFGRKRSIFMTFYDCVRTLSFASLIPFLLFYSSTSLLPSLCLLSFLPTHPTPPFLPIPQLLPSPPFLARLLPILSLVSFLILISLLRLRPSHNFLLHLSILFSFPFPSLSIHHPRLLSYIPFLLSLPPTLQNVLFLFPSLPSHPHPFFILSFHYYKSGFILI